MSDTIRKSTRRDILKTVGGVLGGVSLLGHGTAQGQAIGSLPSGYNFYRILTANEGGSFSGVPNQLGDISGSVMMAAPPSSGGIGYVYVHGTQRQPYGTASGVFEVAINFSHTPPVVQRVLPMALERSLIYVDGRARIAGHIGTGASNAQGQFVTTIEPYEPSDQIETENSPGVYLYQPHGNGGGAWSRIIGFGDEVPDGSSLYGGDFGDVALDNDGNLLLAAATTHDPSDSVSGFGSSQALISTSIGNTNQGRVLLQTGDLLPFGSAVVEAVGLVDLAPRNAFAAQVTARRLGPSVLRSGTALIVGNTQGGPGQQGLVAASPELMPPGLAAQRNITSGETFFGARVDPLMDVGFVTHDGTFEPSIGSNAIEALGYYSRGLARNIQNTQLSASDNQVAAFGAPCIGSTGLMYGTEMLGSGKSRLYISNGVSSKVVLNSGEDQISGRNPSDPLVVSEILFGHHSTQVDASGRLVFTAEFLKDPKGPDNASNVITALVIGIPR
ncbi:MAG: hypothetical protein ABJF23_28880 [Bryobacteraceae bacterium]